MGASASSRSIIDVEVATQRLGYAEVSKIEEGFARLAVGGCLRRADFRTGFLNSVAGAPVPEAFASALFDGFDTTASGRITVKEFVCALAVIRKGKPEERLRLLFAVYDADRDKRLSDRDLERFAQALQDGRAGATREKAVDEALKALSAKGQGVGFESFAHWAQRNMDSPLIDWVFDIEQKLESELRGGSSDSRMIPFERTVSGEGRDDEQDLVSLSRGIGMDVDVARDLRAAWRALVAGSQFGVVDAEAFLRECKTFPPRLAEQFFRALDVSGSGTVSLEEWMRGLGACFGGGREEREALCCRIFAARSPKSPREAEEAVLGLDAEGAQELRRYADAWAISFTGAVGGEEQLPVEAALTAAQLAVEPWASRVDVVVRCLGCLARVGLALQPRDPREERGVVDWLNSKFDPEDPGAVGDTWYLLPARWWQLWCECTGPHAKSRRTITLSSIDNASLVDHASLRIGLNHRVDYEVVTAAAWRALQAWYGGPGPPLPRTVIEVDGRRELEMYPLRVRVNRTDGMGDVLLLDKVMEVSRATLLSDVKVLACALHEITHPVTLYHRSSLHVDWEQGDEAQSLHALGFIDGHWLLLQTAGKLHPVTPSPSGARSPRGGRGVLAAVGLQNLGNTCYMNASLQCLVHTPLLPRYFGVEYRYDLSTAGNWGMAGKLAVAFAEFLGDVQSARANGTGVVAPRAFRRTIGDFQPQFAGWKQQDAQEFLSVFLAGLSEDVNRTRNKPYVELKDSEGRPDDVVAQEFWSAHCRREQSAIAALFSSQFKSVLRCKVCGHENAAFDPFSFMPIPLPQHDFRWVTCSVVTAPRASALDQHTMQVCTRVPKTGHVSDLLQAVAGLVGLAPAELVVAEVGEGYIFRLLEHRHSLSLLSDDARPMVFHAPLQAPQSRRPSFARDRAPAEPPAAAPEVPRLETRAPQAEDVADAISSRDVSLMDTAEEGVPHRLPASPTMSSPAGSSAPEDAGEAMVYLVHRRLRKVQRYFLNPYKSELFGTPVVLRVPSSIAASELYAAVLRLVWHFVPDYDASVAGWPFVLSTVKRDGTACAHCTWRQGCLGCEVPVQGTAPMAFRDGDTLGIDWDAVVLERQYKVKIAAHIHTHESVDLAQIERKSPERLNQCLDTLVKEEELTAYCRECTKAAGEYTEAPHAKALRVWACGPLLVLQLKRFHSNGGTSYKLHNLVAFPTTLDLEGYMARDGEALGVQGKVVAVPASDGGPAGAQPKLVLRGGSGGDAAAMEANAALEEPAAKIMRSEAAADGAPGSGDAKDDVVFRSLSREVTTYRLYGVVNHMGGMGSGHYTAFVRSGPEQSKGAGAPSKWLCCDDDRVYEISEEDVVTANAYLLFYARADVAAQEVGLHVVFPTHASEAPAADVEQVKSNSWARAAQGSAAASAASAGRGAAAAQLGNSGFCGVM